MIVTILAVAFLIIVGFAALLGYKMVISGGPDSSEQQMERCAICRERVEKSELILRQIGDHKLLFFCRKCITTLYADLGLKN